MNRYQNNLSWKYLQKMLRVIRTVRWECNWRRVWDLFSVYERSCLYATSYIWAWSVISTPYRFSTCLSHLKFRQRDKALNYSDNLFYFLNNLKKVHMMGSLKYEKKLKTESKYCRDSCLLITNEKRQKIKSQRVKKISSLGDESKV